MSALRFFHNCFRHVLLVVVTTFVIMSNDNFGRSLNPYHLIPFVPERSCNGMQHFDHDNGSDNEPTCPQSLHLLVSQIYFDWNVRCSTRATSKTFLAGHATSRYTVYPVFGID